MRDKGSALDPGDAAPRRRPCSSTFTPSTRRLVPLRLTQSSLVCSALRLGFPLEIRILTHPMPTAPAYPATTSSTFFHHSWHFFKPWQICCTNAFSSHSCNNSRPADSSHMAPSRQIQYAIALVLSAILSGASYGEGEVLFSQLPNALVVTATLPGGGPIKEVTVGQEAIVVTWTANTTAVVPITATKVRTSLCFATESQTQRAWRATKDNLSKDKTCLLDIATASYTPTGASFTWTLPERIPGAKFFVRAYALDGSGAQVAYGQSSPDKTANTFTVIPISGRNSTLNVAVAIMSIMSIALLFGALVVERVFLQRKKSV